MSHCLHSACVGGNVSVFTRLLETEDPNIVDEEGLSLLHSAVQGGHVGILQALLLHQALHVNCVDRAGQTPLLLACTQGRDKVTRILVKHTQIKLDVNKRCVQGFTPLIAASMAGFRFCVKV